jgi:hypothetical protein
MLGWQALMNRGVGREKFRDGLDSRRSIALISWLVAPVIWKVLEKLVSSGRILMITSSAHFAEKKAQNGVPECLVQEFLAQVAFPTVALTTVGLIDLPRMAFASQKRSREDSTLETLLGNVTWLRSEARFFSRWRLVDCNQRVRELRGPFECEPVEWLSFAVRLH